MLWVWARNLSEDFVRLLRAAKSHRAELPEASKSRNVPQNLGPCLDAKTKISKKIPAPAWRLKSRRNKKRIATAVCKWRDESNEPN